MQRLADDILDVTKIESGVKAIFQFTQADRERLTKVAKWVDQNNDIRVNIDRTFSLDEAADALDYQKVMHHMYHIQQRLPNLFLMQLKELPDRVTS